VGGTILKLEIMASIEFEEKCLDALKGLDYSKELKLYVINAEKSKEKFESLGGTEDIYYHIKNKLQGTLQEIIDNKGVINRIEVR